MTQTKYSIGLKLCMSTRHWLSSRDVTKVSPLARARARTRLDNAGQAKHGTVETFKLNISSGGTSFQPNKDESCSE